MPQPSEVPESPYKTLRLLLKALSVREQRLLSCAYARHVAWLCAVLIPEDLSHDYLAACAAYVRGGGDFATILEHRHNFNAHLFPEAGKSEEFDARFVSSVVGAANAIDMACIVCCQPELVAIEEYSRHDRRMKCEFVARECANAVASHFSNQEWTLWWEGPQRTPVRDEGHKALRAEILWQIEQAHQLAAPNV